jgi:hypothetical protein
VPSDDLLHQGAQRRRKTVEIDTADFRRLNRGTGAALDCHALRSSSCRNLTASSGFGACFRIVRRQVTRVAGIRTTAAEFAVCKPGMTMLAFSYCSFMEELDRPTSSGSLTYR